MKLREAPQPPTYLEKFQQLRRVIEGIDPARYDQNVFGEKTACGTFMCIAGHAAHDAWFQAHGWEAVWNSGLLDVRVCGEPFVIDFGTGFFGRNTELFYSAGSAGGPSSLQEALQRCDAVIAELEREEVTV